LKRERGSPPGEERGEQTHGVPPRTRAQSMGRRA